MEIIKINIDEIKPYENNAKLHPYEQIEQIKKSILEFGNNDPIAIDKDNTIIEGHGRYLALKELGYDEVEVIKLSHLSEEQKKAYILVHNKLTMNTGFDMDILNEELSNIINIDMSDFDFDFEIDTNYDVYEDIDDLGRGSVTSHEHKLKVDNIEMILTEDEFELFVEKYNKYVDENGVSFGFIGEILKNDRNS